MTEIVEEMDVRAPDDEASCDGRCLDQLLDAWPVTGFDEAATLTRRLRSDVLETLLDFEREHSDRPRYRRLLRRRIDAASAADQRDDARRPCACPAPVLLSPRTSGTAGAGGPGPSP